MARIQCKYVGCVHLDDGFCAAPSIRLDPDEGCLTFTRRSVAQFEDDWNEDEESLSDWQEEGYEDWLDDEGEDDFDF